MTENNLIPIRTAQRFFLCKGELNESGDLVNKEKVGFAFLRPTSTMFRLRLWMFPKGEYYLAREQGKAHSYLALARDEYQTADQTRKVDWQKIGYGDLLGGLIRIRLHLITDDIFLCILPPENENSGEVSNVA